MGLIWESKSDQLKKEIVKEVEFINGKLMQASNLLDKKDGDVPTLANNVLPVVNEHLQAIATHQKIVEGLLSRLSEPERARLLVPRVDGQKVPFYLYDMSFRMMGQVIVEAIDEIEKKINNYYR
jgi:hypothetical protein